MKAITRKALLAALVLSALPAVASAQTSVTQWGIFDGAVYMWTNRTTAAGTGVPGDSGTLASIASGAWQTSRWQLRGSLDLVGDLKGVAELGTSLNLSNGTFNNAGRTFDRIAYVGVSSGTFGNLQFGRQPSLLHDVITVTDPLRANASTTNPNVRFAYLVSPGAAIAARFGPNPATAGNGQDRIDNAVKYIYRNSGVIAELQYGFGGVANSIEANSYMAGLLGYDGYGLTVRASYNVFKDGTSTSPVSLNAFALGANYQVIPELKLMATFANNKIDGGNHQSTTVASGGLKWTATPELDVTGAYYYTTRSFDAPAADQTVHKVAVVPEYKFAKGFLGYVILVYESYADAGSTALSTGGTIKSGETSSVYAAGGFSYTW